MNIVLIGAGNVATHLGQALARADHRILQVYSRTEASAAALAEKLNAIYAEEASDVKSDARSNAACAEEASDVKSDARSNAACTEEASDVNHVKGVKGKNGTSNKISPTQPNTCKWSTTLTNIDPTADLYLVMLKDSILSDILPELVKSNPQALFVHTAGSVPMNIWEGLTTRYGVLYPMQTFSKARAVDFSHVHFFIEANTSNDVEILKDLAKGISDYVVEASSEQRKYLHLSAVFACNFTNHMYAICDELLTAHGLPFSSMVPLIDETARKVHHLNPKEAQTGPAQRNDTNVMLKQETLLKEDEQLNDPAIAELYRLISQHIVKYQQDLDKASDERSK